MLCYKCNLCGAEKSEKDIRGIDSIDTKLGVVSITKPEGVRQGFENLPRDCERHICEDCLTKLAGVNLADLERIEALCEKAEK